jgi:hypothetical protein
MDPASAEPCRIAIKLHSGHLNMRLSNPLEALHMALAAALYRDLPLITYSDRDWDAWRALDTHAQGQAMKTNTVPTMTKTRRPHQDDVEIIMFPQTWGSTALGYGGMGGAAVTSAYTVVVSDGMISCVYFGQERLAYKINYNLLNTQGRENWRTDLCSQKLADCRTAPQRYTTEHTSC